MRRATQALCLLGLVTALGGCEGPVSPPAGAPAPVRAATRAPGLHVSGNRLLDAHGRRVRLRGINRSGTEYACIQGWGTFDGPDDAASVAAMAAWRINFVRIPLNEDCWLGIGGVKPGLGGAAYRRAIVRYVRLLHRNGMYAELSLMWGAPGAYRATYQSGGPDADHAPAVWRGMARAFRHDPNVILAPWGETIANADCFRNGGVCEATFGPRNTPYRLAGMQQAVRVMRAAGYRGVIAIPGIDYANNLSQWLSHRPRDPRGQLVAEAHVYGGNTCASAGCLRSTMEPVARRVPLILGETGETYDGKSCAARNTSRFLRWADAHAAGYAVWTWNTWGDCSSLISRFDGTPNAAFGRYVRAHLRARPARRLRGGP